jgi:5-(carboxyamino)imidazole ribonucleotide synthase
MGTDVRIQTIGVIGGGQLGRMFTLDAKRMGYDVVTLDPQERSPCGQVADEQIVATYDNLAAIDALGKRTDVVTYEFENIAIGSIEYLEKNRYHVTPGSNVLRVTQDRLLEKQFVQDCGIATAPFARVNSLKELEAAASTIGFPAVIKTARGGYDGKGQWRVDDFAAAHAAFSSSQQSGSVASAEMPSGDEKTRNPMLIFEGFVPFVKELSVVATRNAHDEIVTYPVGENEHDAGILAMTIAPARVEEPIATKAREIAAKIGSGLAIVGTYCVELFLTANGEILVNEIAPRPHNSGHYTMDATQCSQYEQHVRAICNLPLSPPRLLSNVIMMNILGTGTGDRLSGVEELLRDPNIVLHMYGKRHAVSRRKMGHFTMLIEGPINEAAITRAKTAHARLRWI